MSGGNQSSIMGIHPAIQAQLNFKDSVSHPGVQSDGSSADFKISSAAAHHTAGTLKYQNELMIQEE